MAYYRHSCSGGSLLICKPFYTPFSLSCEEVRLLCQVTESPREHRGIRIHLQKQSLYSSSGLDLQCAQHSRTRSESQLSCGGVLIIAEVGIRVLRFRTPDWHMLPCEQSENSISWEPESSQWIKRAWGSSGCVSDTAQGFTTNPQQLLNAAQGREGIIWALNIVSCSQQHECTMQRRKCPKEAQAPAWRPSHQAHTIKPGVKPTAGNQHRQLRSDHFFLVLPLLKTVCAVPSGKLDKTGLI